MLHKNLFWQTGWVFLLLLTFNTHSYALKNDRNQPIEVSSNSAERNQKQGITLYHGNVMIQQGSVLIEAETVTIKTRFSSADASEELEEIITLGKPSHMQQKMENGEIVDASGTTIQYKVAEATVTLLGSATLKQGARVISGERIIYDIGAQKILAGDEKERNLRPTPRVKVTIPPRLNPPSNIKQPATGTH